MTLFFSQGIYQTPQLCAEQNQSLYHAAHVLRDSLEIAFPPSRSHHSGESPSVIVGFYSVFPEQDAFL
jgi:hypothetical protein